MTRDRPEISAEMYFKMGEIAAKYDISVGEVRVTLLRYALHKIVGFECDHRKKIRISKNGTAYCKRCWRFMNQMRRSNPKPGQAFTIYVPKKTFIELMDEEKIGTGNAKADPMSGLQPDQRGGE